MNTMDYPHMRQQGSLVDVYRSPLGGTEPRTLPDYRSNNIGPGWAQESIASGGSSTTR